MPLDAQAWFLFGLCCCDACAAAAGVDRTRLVAPIQERLRAAFNGEPLGQASREALASISAEISALLEARVDGLTDVLARLIGRSNVPLRALVGSGLVEQPWARGIDLAAWARLAPSVTVNAYHGLADDVRRTLSSFRDAAPEANLVVGLNATYPTTADEDSLRLQTRAALEHSPLELSYYNYGLLGLDRLAWVGRAAAVVRSARDEAVLGN
jgi:hypothetical protein